MKGFLIKWKKDLLIGVISIIAAFFLGGTLISSYVIATTKIETIEFMTLFVYLVAFIFLYILSKNIRGLINQRPVIINILSLFLPLLIFSFQFATDILSSSIATENVVKQSTDINYKLLEFYAQQESVGSKSGFWYQPDSAAYKDYWAYISKNYPDKCLSAYNHSVLEIDRFNLLNNQRHALDLIKVQSVDPVQKNIYSDLDKSYAQLQLAAATSTMANLSYAMQHCQDFRQKE